MLVHYSESSENSHTDGEVQPVTHWRDRVWRFERVGDGEDGRLRWTIFDGVFFRDRRGRFETVEGGREARTLGAWEPDAAQLAEVRAGLDVDDHDVRSKTLSGSDRAGYRSSSQARPRSTSTIAYQEIWRIEGGPDGPVFTREAIMGAGRTDDLSGRIRLLTRTVAHEGTELSGDFEQDGAALGRFRMWRTGTPRVAGGRAGADG